MVRGMGLWDVEGNMSTTEIESATGGEMETRMSQEQFVYFFGDGAAEGNGQMKDLLGGKGAGLAEMTNAGVPVPPGFTITTAVCRWYYANGKQLPHDFRAQQGGALERLEASIGKKLGDANDPLLVSVRSGAKFSMPGMMDTVLNLGLNDKSVQGLAAKTGNARFAWDCYRRFIQMYGSVVLNVDHHQFEEIIEFAKLEAGVSEDTGLTATEWRRVVAA